MTKKDRAKGRPGVDRAAQGAMAAALREAEALRRDWMEGLRHYELRIEAQFTELRRRLKPPAKGKGKAVPSRLLPPSAKEAKDILEDLDRARLKPAKGRSKDLRRVEDALDRAIGRLPPP